MLVRNRLAGFGVLMALLSCNAYAVNCSSGQTKHYIKVSSGGEGKWSVYADLELGNGQKVYHWQETGKSAGSSTYWEYCDGHDNGRLQMWFYPRPNQKIEKLNLPLGRDHCFRVMAASSMNGLAVDINC